jgi:hypothetical protein
MAKDPNAAAARWAQNLAGAGPRIGEGVNNVTVAPGQAAARQKQVWLANVQGSADKWAARTAAVSLQEWQQAMIQKGAPRIAAGAQAAQAKMAAFLTAFLPHVEAGVRALPPRGNLEQNIDRMARLVRHNASFGQRGGAR